MSISVVIPIYHGQHTISDLVERLDKVLPGIAGVYEIILVCDGSPVRRPIWAEPQGSDSNVVLWWSSDRAKDLGIYF